MCRASVTIAVRPSAVSGRPGTLRATSAKSERRPGRNCRGPQLRSWDTPWKVPQSLGEKESHFPRSTQGSDRGDVRTRLSYQPVSFKVSDDVAPPAKTPTLRSAGGGPSEARSDVPLRSSASSVRCGRPDTQGHTGPAPPGGGRRGHWTPPRGMCPGPAPWHRRGAHRVLVKATVGATVSPRRGDRACTLSSALGGLT